ncbi:MAG: murein hydrolase activator EnvC family protein [Armatimonadota bacterium]
MIPWRLPVAASLAVWLTMGFAVPVAARQGRTVKRVQLRDRLDRIGGEIQRTRSELRRAKRAEEEIAGDLDRVEDRLRSTRSNLRDATERLQRSRQAQTRAESQLGGYVRDLSEHERRLARRLVANYRQGPVRYLSVLLGARTMGEFVGRASFIRALVRHDARLIAEVGAARDRVLDWKHRVDARARDASRDARRLAQRQEEQSTVMGERRELLSEARDRRREIEAQLAGLEEDSRAIARRLRALSRTAAGRARGGKRFAGGMVAPVDGGVTSTFGMRFHPILRRSRMHDGVDFSAVSGEPIRAAASGVVVFSGTMRGYGRVVVVDHGGGVSTLYAHCSAILAAEGRDVSRGQVIARVGSTGLSTGPHLHFEMRRNGTPVAPPFR